MSISRNIIATGCCLAALWGCARQPAVEESADLTEQMADLLPDQPTDPAVVTAAPESAHTMFANEWVGVARVNLAPGQLVPPNEAGIRYVYPLSSCTLSVVDNGSEEVVHLAPGELTVWPAGRLSVANVDETSGEFLLVERNPIETSPDLETLTIPEVAIEMERHGTVMLDNDNVIVVDITLDELAKDPLPSNLPLLVIALSDCDLALQGDTVPDDEYVLKDGEAIWQPAGCNVVVSIGDAKAHFLVLGFRK